MVPRNRTSRQRVRTRKVATATNVPTTVNSYMLAHGTRPAARPRSSSPTPWKARPSVVVAIAIPTALRCGTTSAGAATTVVPPASRAPPPSLAAASLAAASLASATLASAARRAAGRPTRSARCARSNANATNPMAYAVVAPTTSRVLSSPRSIATPVLTRGRAPDRVHHPFQLTGKAQVVPAGKGGGVDNCTSVMIGHSEPDPPPWCEQGHREPGKGGQREPEDRSERRVMAQVERDEPRGALPGQRPQPTRQAARAGLPGSRTVTSAAKSTGRASAVNSAVNRSRPTVNGTSEPGSKALPPAKVS